MADWYVSSASYAGIAAFVPSAVYSVGQVVKPTAPALKAQWALRCTVAGTASTEPAWPTANNGTVVSGGATFQNVTGQAAYFWAAAAGDLATLITTGNRLAGGDRVFLSSDHTETQTSATVYGSGTSGPQSYNLLQFLCVNRAGSTPPVAADLATGAIVIVSAGIAMNFLQDSPCYYDGITFQYAGTTSGIRFDSGGTRNTYHYFRNCVLWLNTATAGCAIFPNTSVRVTLDNTPVRFGNAGQSIGTNPSAGNWDFLWLNTPNAIQTTTPTILFRTTAATGTTTVRGVDLSAVTGTLVDNSRSNGHKWLFDSCRIASGLTRYSVASVTGAIDEVELVNCFDGTNIIGERYQPGGVVTTERSITLSGGATDNVGTFSHKLVSNTNIDKYANTLNGFWMDVECQAVGASKTATVEIISSASLNTDEVSLLVEYQGTIGSPVASFGTSLPVALTTPSAITASTATWNSSPATPVKQLLSVAFTPQLAGRVRGQVRLGKASTTVYINPVMAIA